MLLFQLRFNTVKSKIFSLTLAISLLIAISGCQESIDNALVALGKPELAITSVDHIDERKNGQTVYVKGTVIHRSPFLGSAAYQLQDETGSVWVFTDNPLPTQGTEIFIKGKIQQEILPLSEQELGEFYLVELQQLTN